MALRFVDAPHRPLLETAMEWYRRMIEAGRGEEECAGVFETLAAASKRN